MSGLSTENIPETWLDQIHTVHGRDGTGLVFEMPTSDPTICDLPFFYVPLLGRLEQLLGTFKLQRLIHPERVLYRVCDFLGPDVVVPDDAPKARIHIRGHSLFVTKARKSEE